MTTKPTTPAGELKERMTKEDKDELINSLASIILNGGRLVLGEGLRIETSVNVVDISPNPDLIAQAEDAAVRKFAEALIEEMSTKSWRVYAPSVTVVNFLAQYTKKEKP